MSWLRLVSCLLASLVLNPFACQHAPRVQVMGESTRLMRSEPSPVESSVFDGKVVSLRGARGETLGLQVRISDGRRRSASLRLPPSVAHVVGFTVGSLEVRQPSSDLYGSSHGPGSYPDILLPQPDGVVPSSDLAYFDVEIQSAAAPGHYDGELVVDGQPIPVVLDVSRARIDLDRDPLVWAFYLPSELARVHGLLDDDSPELMAVEQTYYDLFRAHGVLLASDVSPARFPVRRSFVRDVRFWPVGIDTSSDDAIADDVHRWLELFRDLSATPFAIPIDEPHTLDQKMRARHIADVIGSAGGGRPRLLRGVTDVAAPLYGNAIDVFISPKNLPTVALERHDRGEHFWTYNGRPPEAGSMILDTDGLALRTWGWIAYRYDVELWYAWEGLYFSDRYNGGGPTAVMGDPITFDERRRGGEDWGNGDGILAYPGPLPSLRLKELRRGLQDRLLLRELDACGGGDEAQSIARRIVPRALAEAGAASSSWPTLESTWEGARRQLLDAIEVSCHDDAELDR
jgi:hypothetical protein